MKTTYPTNDTKDTGEEWISEPKLWTTHNKEDWTEEMTKERNGPKCCLHSCGTKNTKEMVRCDGCGRWAHIKCQQHEQHLEEDFICKICKVDANLSDSAETTDNAEETSVEASYMEVLSQNTPDETLNHFNINQQKFVQRRSS